MENVKVEVEMFWFFVFAATLMFSNFGDNEIDLYDAVMLKLAPEYYVLKGTPDAED